MDFAWIRRVEGRIQKHQWTNGRAFTLCLIIFSSSNNRGVDFEVYPLTTISAERGLTIDSAPLESANTVTPSRLLVVSRFAPPLHSFSWSLDKQTEHLISTEISCNNIFYTKNNIMRVVYGTFVLCRHAWPSVQGKAHNTETIRPLSRAATLCQTLRKQIKSDQDANMRPWFVLTSICSRTVHQFSWKRNPRPACVENHRLRERISNRNLTDTYQ